MKKIKEVWSKLKYWQKGGVIGLIFTIIVQIYGSIIYKGYSGILAIINGIPLLISIFIDKSVYLADITPISVTTITFITVWNVIMGIVLGKIYGYLKSKYSKSMKFNIFILCLIIFLYLVITIFIYLYIYINSRNMKVVKYNPTITKIDNTPWVHFIGNITSEIPNTYLYIPSEDGSELISILTSKPITFVVEATEEGAFNLSINKYDRNTSTQINLEYEDVQITNQTTATVNITSTNPNFIMQIDGDGIIDDTALPDNTTIEGNYTQEETDSDNDGLADSIDNCPNLYNPNQNTDFDNDGFDNLLCGGLDCDDNNALINPSAIEECNNIDDNCNNEIDEDLTRTCGITDIGICTYGTEICELGNWMNCDAVFPSDELCNNLDDDCDDLIDEDFDVGEICEAGIGECRREGKKICSNDGLTTICDAVPGEPSKEICDNKDNDCDGVIDNNCARYTKEFTIELLENAKDNILCKRRGFCKDREINKVIDNIKNSLDLRYYVDDETLNPKQGKDNGQFVFTHELKAVVQCLRGKRFRAIDPVCKDVAEYLVVADKFFAEKALNDAKSTEIINPENKKCFDREINKAEKNIKKADDLLPKKFPSIAINLYKNSWKASQKAIEIANSEKDICGKKKGWGFRWWWI